MVLRPAPVRGCSLPVGMQSPLPVLKPSILLMLLVCLATNIAFGADKPISQTSAENALLSALKEHAAKKPHPRSTSCPCGAGCQCTNGECGCGTVHYQSKTSPGWGVADWLVYQIAYDKALKEKKPLIVWIGESCPLCEKQWTDYIHTRVYQYRDDNGTVTTGPCCKVGKPNSLGFNVVKTFDGIPSEDQVQAVLKGVEEPVVKTTQQVPIFAPAPIMFPPAMAGGGGC